VKRLGRLLGTGVDIVSGYFPGWLVVIMVCVVMGGVLTRYATRHPWAGADEISAFLLVIISFMGLAYAWKERGHIRISFFVKLIPRRVAKWVRLATLAGTLAFVPILAWAFYGLVARSIRIGSKSFDLFIPLQWPQIFVLIGSVLLFFWLLVEMVRAVRAIRRGEGEEI